MSPALIDEERVLLRALWNELPLLKRKVELVKLIGRHPRAHACRNAALAFGFNHACVAIIESQLLRFAEAIELIENARLHQGADSLFTGKGRSKQAKDEDIHLLMELRSKRVAHRVKLRAAGDAAFDEVRRKHEHVFAFLLCLNEKIEALLEQLHEGGLFAGITAPLWLAVMPATFTSTDLDALIDAANGISADSSNAGG